LRESICTLYGGQSIDCSPTRYQIDCENRQQSNISLSFRRFAQPVNRINMKESGCTNI
jgi:hypothetical protein